jgi:hypothetical protein
VTNKQLQDKYSKVLSVRARKSAFSMIEAGLRFPFGIEDLRRFPGVGKVTFLELVANKLTRSKNQ